MNLRGRDEGRGRAWRGSGGRGDGRAGGGRGQSRGSSGAGEARLQVCRLFQQGSCRFGERCRFSHEAGSTMSASSRDNARSGRTAEEVSAREDYISWKSILRAAPRQNDLRSIQQLWTGALDLLLGGEKDWQQRLLQDLVDEGNLHGYEHIQALLSMRPITGGQARFVELARPFLMVISHPAVLDCLSVDIYVGNLYNFISGSGGNRAIPFFQHIVNSLSDEHLKTAEPNKTATESTFVALATALREVMRRTPKALLHEDLPKLAESISKAVGQKADSVAIHTVVERVAEL